MFYEVLLKNFVTFLKHWLYGNLFLELFLTVRGIEDAAVSRRSHKCEAGRTGLRACRISKYTTCARGDEVDLLQQVDRVAVTLEVEATNRHLCRCCRQSKQRLHVRIG